MEVNNKLKKYIDYTEEWIDKEVKLSNCIKKWLYHNLDATSEEMQRLFESVSKQIKEIKEKASNELAELNIKDENILSGYLEIRRQEIIKANPVVIDDSNFIYNQASPDGKNDTFNPELEQSKKERGRQLNNILNRLMQKEIDFEKAESQRKLVDNTYGFTRDSLLKELNELNELIL